ETGDVGHNVDRAHRHGTAAVYDYEYELAKLAGGVCQWLAATAIDHHESRRPHRRVPGPRVEKRSGAWP
ncbi:MAG: hypothetical protein ACE5G2_05330, partial [Candidatus Krumholzibacteriia bacterium]